MEARILYTTLSRQDKERKLYWVVLLYGGSPLLYLLSADNKKQAGECALWYNRNPVHRDIVIGLFPSRWRALRTEGKSIPKRVREWMELGIALYSL